jgi:1-acyl-sn-glycerol-3-phosphate acyltransferase
MKHLLRFLFYRVLVKFVVLIVLGLNVRHRERLPVKGPAILVANHNSHLDTMVLMTLIPGNLLRKTKPVAAMDYFMRNPYLAWFAINIVGIIPIERASKKSAEHPLQVCYDAIDEDHVLIFFPEGSRGEPEEISKFKGGISVISEKYPKLPIIPILLHGLGKSLPKGEALLVPFFCDVFIGEPIHWTGDRKSFMQQLDVNMQQLASEGEFPDWE